MIAIPPGHNFERRAEGDGFQSEREKNKLAKNMGIAATEHVPKKISKAIAFLFSGDAALHIAARKKITPDVKFEDHFPTPQEVEAALLEEEQHFHVASDLEGTIYDHPAHFVVHGDGEDV